MDHTFYKHKKNILSARDVADTLITVKSIVIDTGAIMSPI